MHRVRAAWREFVSWHRPLPATEAELAELKAQRVRRRAMLGRLVRLRPHEHVSVWREAVKQYRNTWTAPTMSHSPASAAIDAAISERQRTTVERMRAEAAAAVHGGARQAQRGAPVVAVWLREQLFLLRLSVRSFLTGYAEGKAEAESRDWIRIQQQIFADDPPDSPAAQSHSPPPPPPPPAPAATKARPTTMPSNSSSSLHGVEFVRRRKKPLS